jgi:hypothetical protein
VGGYPVNLAGQQCRCLFELLELLASAAQRRRSARAIKNEVHDSPFISIHVFSGPRIGIRLGWLVGWFPAHWEVMEISLSLSFFFLFSLCSRPFSLFSFFELSQIRDMMHIKQARDGKAGPGQGQGENGSGFSALFCFFGLFFGLVFWLVWISGVCFLFI